MDTVPASSVSTNIAKGIYTILRDKTTPREDFIFTTDRLSTFLMEQAMVYLPFSSTTITTPTGTENVGKVLSTPVSRIHVIDD